MAGLWGDKTGKAMQEKYLKDTPGYYTTGDAGFMDHNGYLHIMTRIDDVINTAGHRLSTGRLEEVVNEHPLVAESAVIGVNDPIRTDSPLAYVVLRCKATDISPKEKL